MRFLNQFWLAMLLTVSICLANVFAQQNSAKQSESTNSGPTNSGPTNSGPTNSAATNSTVQTTQPADEKSDRKTHFHLGAVTASAGYGRGFYGGNRFSPYGGFYYDAFGSPFWGPYYGFPGFAYDNGKGDIKLAADPSNAEVYVDGAYAGTANHLKDIWLDPGAYDLSVSATGRQTFKQRVYVLSGKTLKLSAKLTAEKSQP